MTKKELSGHNGFGARKQLKSRKPLLDRRATDGSVQSAAAVFPSGPGSSGQAVQLIWLAIVGRGDRHALCHRANDRGRLAASGRGGATLPCLIITLGRHRPQ